MYDSENIWCWKGETSDKMVDSKNTNLVENLKEIN